MKIDMLFPNAHDIPVSQYVGKQCFERLNIKTKPCEANQLSHSIDEIPDFREAMNTTLRKQRRFQPERCDSCPVTCPGEDLDDTRLYNTTYQQDSGHENANRGNLAFDLHNLTTPTIKLDSVYVLKTNGKKRIPADEVKRRWRERQVFKQHQLFELQKVDQNDSRKSLSFWGIRIVNRSHYMLNAICSFIKYKSQENY